MIKFLNWFGKSAWQYVNVAALIAVYALNKGSDGIELVAGLWLFLLLGAVYGWKLFNKK